MIDVSIAIAEPRVSVCICTRNRPEELARCVESILESRYPVHEIIVSDDGDDRPLVQEICERSGAIYARGPRRGLCANRNRALKKVSGSHVLFLDDDARLGDDFLEQAAAFIGTLDSAETAAMTIVAGREMRPDGHRTEAREQSFLGFQEILYAPHSEMRTVVINAALFPAAMFESLRFDERIRYGYDEVDITTRAVASGYRIAALPGAINLHAPSPSSREGYDRVVDASRLYVTFKRYARTDRDWGRAAAFSVVAPAHLIGAAVKDAGPRGALGAYSALRLAASNLRAGRHDRAITRQAN